MAIARLDQCSSIHLVHDQLDVVVDLEYSKAEHAFVAVLTGSGLLGPSEALRLKLPDHAIQNIVYQPDGTLRLNV